MAKKKPKFKSEDQLILGQVIERLRTQKGMHRKELGRIVKVTEQQIARYESGDFVPITMLEHIAESLDAPIQKKIIRQISSLRFKIAEKGEEPDALCAIYSELFEDEWAESGS